MSRPLQVVPHRLPDDLRLTGHDKYNAKTLKIIETSLKLCNTRNNSAKLAGITIAMFYEWMRDSTRLTFGNTRDPDEPLMTFADMVLLAEAEAVHHNLLIIKAAAQGGQVRRKRTFTKRNGDVVEEVELCEGQWTAAAWLLERTQPETFMQRKAVTVSSLSDEDLLKRAGAVMQNLMEAQGEVEQLPEHLETPDDRNRADAHSEAPAESQAR